MDSFPLMIFPTYPRPPLWEPTAHMRFINGVLQQKWAEQAQQSTATGYEWRSNGKWEWRDIPSE